MAAAATVPVDPLVRFWKSRNSTHLHTACTCSNGGRCASVESLAEALSERVPVSRSTLFRRIKHGVITVNEADKWATALGVHPSHIWHGWERAGIAASLGSKTKGLW